MGQAMFVQLGIGSLAIASTALVAALAWWGLEVVLIRTQGWARRPPLAPKVTLVLALAMLWTVAMLTAAVWIWAALFHWLSIFDTFEAAMYFALVAFTTLGFGDLLLPEDWRLLGGLAAANGLLLFGLMTAMLVETLRLIRIRQRGRLE